MDMLQENFAWQLRLQRRKRRWSQANLARRAKVKQTAISEMERGRRWVRPTVLLRLSKVLEVSVAELLSAPAGLRRGQLEKRTRRSGYNTRRATDSELHRSRGDVQGRTALAERLDE